MSKITLQGFEARLELLLEEHLPNTTCTTFGDAGLLTTDRGLVVRIREGKVIHEFQVTVVRSKGPGDDDIDNT